MSPTFVSNHIEMHIKPIARYRITQVLVILLLWMALGLLMSVHETVIFDFEADQFVINIQDGNTLFNHLIFSLLAPFLGGLFGATLIVFWAIDRFQQYSYGKMLVLHSALYLCIIFVLSVVIGIIYSSIYLQKPFYDRAVLLRVTEFLTGLGIIKVVVSWYIITLISVLLININNKYGPGNLRKMVVGKYHKARTEQRIFMFLDLKSSTAIAEQLGHERYFELIQRLFQLITNDILNHRGEIYQYVGDEVVVTWPMKKGISNGNCIRCFFAVRKRLERHSTEFESDYGLMPVFKAGIHMGKVTVGEIGVVKKDIVFTGDVLNTTSRIMDQCNVHNELLLISDDLYQLMESRAKGYRFASIGSLELRGKSEKLHIHSVQEA